MSAVTLQNMQQIFSYPDNLPSVMSGNQHLDNFEDSSVHFHWHTEFQFGLILSGKINYSIFRSLVNQECSELSVGDGFFINSKVLHGCRGELPGTNFFTFGMPPTYFASHAFGKTYEKIILPVVHSRTPGIFFLHSKKEDQSILDLFRKFYNLEKGKSDYDIQCIQLVCQILEYLYNHLQNQGELLTSSGIPLTHAKRIRSMLDYIHQHYAEPLTVEQIADSANISKRECYRCFREIIGKSPIEYLTKFRLASALYQMTRTDDTLKNISRSCGFESPGYFNKCFKKYYGVSPTQYRI